MNAREKIVVTVGLSCEFSIDIIISSNYYALISRAEEYVVQRDVPIFLLLVFENCCRGVDPLLSWQKYATCVTKA
jgi:hypothetical protein